MEAAVFKLVGDGCLTFFAWSLNWLAKSFDCVDESSLSIAKAMNFSKLPVKNCNVKCFGKRSLGCAKEVKHGSLNCKGDCHHE